MNLLGQALTYFGWFVLFSGAISSTILLLLGGLYIHRENKKAKSPADNVDPQNMSPKQLEAYCHWQASQSKERKVL